MHGYVWKCFHIRRGSVLTDGDSILPFYRDPLRKEINIYKETNVANAPSEGILWEALKAVLRGYIIQYAAYVKKCNIKDLANLEKKKSN